MRLRQMLALGAAMAMLGTVIAIAAPANAQTTETCGGMTATKVGTEGDDFLLGTEGVDVIVGLGGNDIIRGLGGDDYLCGGNGRDRLFGGFGNDHLEGGKKNDIVKGDQGKDMLFGNQGNDRLFGGPGGDVLEGGSGTRDKLFGKGGTMDTCNDPQGTTIYDTCELGDAAPKLGSTVRLPAIGGSVGDLTIHRVLDGGTSRIAFWAPPPGSRFVSVLVTLKPVTGDYSACGSGLRLELRTSTGSLVEQDPGQIAEGGPFSGCSRVAVGDQFSGWVTFELPNGIQPVALETGTGISVDLQSGTPTSPTGQVPGGESALGALTEYNFAGLEIFAVTANEVVDPATPAAGSIQPLVGNRFVAVRISIRNDGDSPKATFRPEADFRVVTSTGFRHGGRDGAVSTSGSRINVQQQIAVGATTSGWLVYEIPVGEQVARIALKPPTFVATASWVVP